MKEIGKLLELLNEYEKVRDKSEYQKLSNKEYKWFSSYYFPLCFGHQENFSGAMTNEFREGTESVICSKKFGFIKWLVENDKIGDNKNSDRYTMMKLMRAEINEGTEVFEGTERYEFVIMILSIQDEPIEFLVSILK